MSEESDKVTKLTGQSQLSSEHLESVVGGAEVQIQQVNSTLTEPQGLLDSQTLRNIVTEVIRHL